MPDSFNKFKKLIDSPFSGDISPTIDGSMPVTGDSSELEQLLRLGELESDNSSFEPTLPYQQPLPVEEPKSSVSIEELAQAVAGKVQDKQQPIAPIMSPQEDVKLEGTSDIENLLNAFRGNQESLEKSQERARRNAMLKGIAEGTQDVMKSAVTKQGGKVDLGGTKYLDGILGDPQKDREAKQKDALFQYKLTTLENKYKDDARMRDSKSDISKLFRGQLDKKGIKVPDTMSGYDALQLLKQGGGSMTEYQKLNLGLQRDRLGLEKKAEKRRLAGQQMSRDKFEFKKDEKEKDRSQKVVDTFNSDGVVKDVTKEFLAADKADRILEKGGKMAPAVMGRLLARMSGEVGVMTDKDVEAFKGSSAWTDAIQRFFERGTSGNLTTEDKALMKNIVGQMRSASYEHYIKRAGIISGQFAAINNVSPDQMMVYLEPAVTEYYKPDSDKKFEEETVLMKSPDGEIREIKKSKMKKYLDMGAEVVK
jgi:hypothetical protein